MSAPNHTLLVELAAQHLQAGRFGEVQTLCDRVIASEPNHPEALRLAGVAAYRSGRCDEGLALVQNALDFTPGYVPAHLDLAGMLYAGGDLEAAIARYDHVFTILTRLPANRAYPLPLHDLIRSICSADPGQWMEMRQHLHCYGAAMERSGRYRPEDAALIEFVFGQLALGAADERAARVRVYLLLRLLAFFKTSSKLWVESIFQRLVLPWMKQALSCGYYDLALELEDLTYREFVEQTETEEHFRRCFDQWAGDMIAAGNRVRGNLPPIEEKTPPPSAPIVGFFLHVASLLAHVEVLLNMLEGMTKLSPAPFHPRVYVFRKTHAGMLKRLSGIGVRVILLDEDCRAMGDSWYHRLVYLRDRLARDGVTALVWLSAATMMPFAFSMRIAPVQIWWAMKYHSLDFPEIDGYVTNSSVERYKKIGARLWRAGRGASLELYDAGLQADAQRIRMRYSPPFQHLLGCFGREEKLDHAAFIDTVIQILQAHPDAAFLWTGKVAPATIQRRFDAAGVGTQCFFIGWVDTKLYAQVIDIFLDSFPFPCGWTLIYAMAAGKPFVSHISNESRETGTHGLIHALLYENKGTQAERRLAKETFSDGRLYFCATNAGEYRENVAQLLANPALREQAGSAARRFTQNFFQDQRASAENFAGHFLEIIAEKYPRHGLPAGNQTS